MWTSCYLDFSVGPVYIRIVLLKSHISEDHLVLAKVHYFGCDFLMVTLIVSNNIG